MKGAASPWLLSDFKEIGVLIVLIKVELIKVKTSLSLDWRASLTLQKNKEMLASLKKRH